MTVGRNQELLKVALDLEEERLEIHGTNQGTVIGVKDLVGEEDLMGMMELVAASMEIMIGVGKEISMEGGDLIGEEVEAVMVEGEPEMKMIRPRIIWKAQAISVVDGDLEGEGQGEAVNMQEEELEITIIRTPLVTFVGDGDLQGEEVGPDMGKEAGPEAKTIRIALVTMEVGDLEGEGVNMGEEEAMMRIIGTIQVALVVGPGEMKWEKAAVGKVNFAFELTLPFVSLFLVAVV